MATMEQRPISNAPTTPTATPERLPTFSSRTATLGAFAVALLLIVAGAVDQRTTASLREEVRSVVESYNTLRAAERIRAALVDAETGQRGYLLTGDPAFLEPYESARRALDGLFRDADQAVGDDQDQRARLARLRAAADERVRIMAETIDLRRANEPEGAVAVVKKGRGRELMDAIRNTVAEIVHAESEHLAGRERATQEAFQWSSAMSWTAEGLGLAGLAAFVALLFRHLRAASKAAESVYQQRELLRTTLASIADAVVTTDADGRVTSLNAVASALTGWSSEEALGQPLETVFQVVNEKTRAPAESPARRTLRSQRAVGPSNHVVLVSKGGAERPIDDSAAPIRTADGRIVGAVLVFRDATERKRAEDELRQLAADLSEADRRKDEFLATLAHELRNPLAPMRNSLQILKLARADDRALTQARVIMERQLGQMVRLVDDLLDVSRIARNKLELRKERVDLSAVIANAVETSKPVIDQGRHHLTVTAPDEPIVLDADPVRLAQVFANLLNNAAKYTPPGGRIEIAAHREGSDACVSVKDTGEGISPEMLPLVFDMFTQVDHSLERSQGGLGIGLTLVRRLTELHGGSVSAASDGVGKGSEFLVRLPILIEGPIVKANGAHGPPPLAAATGNCKVLVVDDNRDAAQSLANVLELLGHQAKVAYDGLAAVELVKTFAPNIVLLDIGLPKLNGYEACRRIRALDLEEPPILVAVTGWGQDRDRQRCKEAGFDHYFTKPVDAHQLLALFAEAPCAAR